MKKTILAALVGLTLLGNSAYAVKLDNKPITYRFPTEYNGKVEIKFPYLVLDDKLASDRINIFLHQDVLHSLPPETPNEKTIELSGADFVDLSLSNMQLIRNGRVLSLTLNAEGCGAYCENYDTNYEFDTRDGRVLTLHEIIKSDSISKVAKIVAKSNVKIIKDFIKKIEKEQENLNKKKVKPKAGDRDAEEIDGQIAMYEQCLSQYDEKEEFSAYGDYKNPGYMTIGELGVSFSHGRCSNHAMRALDDLWEIVHTIKNEDLRPYLTDYGKYIIFGEGDGKVPAINPYAQIYRGQINSKINIIMYLGNLNRKEGDYSRLNDYKYFYTKYRQPIELDLKKSENGDFILVEPKGKEDGSDFAKFTFKIKNGKLVGTWSSKDKTYPFEAVPY